MPVDGAGRVGDDVRGAGRDVDVGGCVAGVLDFRAVRIGVAGPVAAGVVDAGGVAVAVAVVLVAGATTRRVPRLTPQPVVADIATDATTTAQTTAPSLPPPCRAIARLPPLGILARQATVG